MQDTVQDVLMLDTLGELGTTPKHTPLLQSRTSHTNFFLNFQTGVHAVEPWP